MKIIAVKVFQLKQLKRRNLKTYGYFIYSYSFLNLRDKYELSIDQLPVGLIAQLVRALQRYGRAHGFDSRSSLNVFRFLLFNCFKKLKHLHCDDLHIVLPLSAVQIYDYYFIYSSVLIKGCVTGDINGRPK